MVRGGQWPGSTRETSRGLRGESRPGTRGAGRMTARRPVSGHMNAAPGRAHRIIAIPASRARPSAHTAMTSPFRFAPRRAPSYRFAAVAAFAALALAGCDKPDSNASAPDHAASAVAQAAAQAASKLDQAASFVDSQIAAAKAGVASAASAVPPVSASDAQAHLKNAATAAFGLAASAAGSGLETAGRKLQQWSRENAASSSDADQSANR